MKKLVLLVAIAIVGASATAAFAVPMCDGPRFEEEGSGGLFGGPVNSEQEAAFNAEIRLRAKGIDAHMTRFWNGCVQTFVRENGHDVMKFYDFDTLREIPVN